MFKKSLLAIVAASALFGFSANSFATSQCEPSDVTDNAIINLLPLPLETPFLPGNPFF